MSETIGTAKPSGGNLSAKITIPDGLGGWHVVQLVQNNKILAQVPFYVDGEHRRTWACPRSWSRRASPSRST